MSDVLDSLRAFVSEIVRDELAKSRAVEPAAHLTVAEYAFRWSLSETTVRAAVRDGRLAHERIGRAVRIPADARIARRERASGAPRDRARLRLLGGRVGG